MSFTTVSAQPSGTAHAWRAGWLRTLCGVSVEGLHASGRIWPPADGHMCQACYRSRRSREVRPLPARVAAWLSPVEDPPRDPPRTLSARVSGRVLVVGAPEGIGPGLRHLWASATTTAPDRDQL